MRIIQGITAGYKRAVDLRPKWIISFWQKLIQTYADCSKKNLLRKFPEFHDERHLGTDSAVLSFFKILLRPDRFLVRLFYGQFIPLPQPLLLSRKLPAGTQLSLESLEWAKIFKKDGVVILPGYFQKEISGMADRYAATAEKSRASKELMARYVSLFDEAFLPIILNEKILSAFADFFGCQPILQDIPVITVVDTSMRAENAVPDEMVTEWHSDDVNTVKIMVFLSPVEKTTTRMQLAKGSHKHCRVHLNVPDAVYSDAYVKSKYEVVDCAGPEGTVILFHANALHKQYRIPQSFRAVIAAKYSPGSGLKFSNEQYKNYFEFNHAVKYFEQMKLSPICREALRGMLDFVKSK